MRCARLFEQAARAAALILVAASSPAAGQAGPAVGPLPEARLDLTAGDVTSVTAGVGLHARGGTYFRTALLGAMGRAWRGNVSGSAARLELQGRFHLDPYRETRLGLYGLGGIAATYDAIRDWQGRLVLGAGVELPARGRAAIAVEGAFAGGVRISVLVRRLPEGRR
ncbi:MAG: hypothetical protein HUU26_05050 [Gemmatimonadaceae bacterium]|nr:hypothetical protein [Gemmatimonadaceae bacterium]